MSEEEQKSKATPDTGALSVGQFAGKASQKVQLDIDDALFLNVVEEDALPAPVEKDLALEAPPPPPLKFWQRRPVQISAGVLLLLVLAFAAYLYFMGAPPPPPAAVDEPTIVVVPSPQSISGEQEYQITFAPFMVEQRDSSTVHFLQTRLTAVTRSKGAADEAKEKMLVLRDAMFYYLRNKTHQFLVEPGSAPTIKQDLIDVVNGYLAKGKIDNFLFENYLLQ